MSDSNIAEDLEIESVANLLIDEFYLLVTRKNSSALVFKRKSKVILKDAWEQFIARADKEEEFEVFFRKEILSVNKFSHLLSLYALMSRVALRFKWGKTEDVSQIIDFLKIEDPLVAEYEKIFFKEKKPSKNTAYKLGCEYSGDFNTKYDFCEDRFTLEVTLLFSAKKRKITAADSATALNSVYRLNKDLFEFLHNKTLPNFFKRNKLPKIGVKEWGALFGLQRVNLMEYHFTLLLDLELRSIVKKSPLDLEGSFHSKVVDSHRFLHAVIHNSSLVTGDRLNLGEEDDFKAGIVLKHPCLKDFENELLTYFINAGKKMSWRKWFFPLSNLQQIFFKEVKRNASNEFFDKFCFLSGSQEFQKKIINFSDHQFLDFWETFPLAAFYEWLGATEIKDIKTSKLLVEKSKSCGMKTEFYEKVPVKRGWWTQYNDYELTDFDINTFPLWVGDFKDNDSQLIALIRSNFAALSGLISKPEVCRILLKRLSGTNEFGKAINLLKDIFGLNLHETLRKFCFNEWKKFLVSCYSEGIKEGKDASDVFIWLYKLDSKFCKQILNRKISAKNAVALLRNIEFSPEAVHFLRSLRVKDSKKIIDVIIERPRLTRGAIRFSKIISDSEFTKVFIKHPKQLLNHARKRLSPSKFFKLSLDHYAVGFAVHESVQYDSRLDLSKIASRVFRGNPLSS